MANPTRSTASATADSGFEQIFAWPNVIAESLMQAQRVQLEALIAWQKSIAAVNQELWDEWVSRWAGGVPIDA